MNKRQYLINLIVTSYFTKRHCMADALKSEVPSLLAFIHLHKKFYSIKNCFFPRNFLTNLSDLQNISFSIIIKVSSVIKKTSGVKPTKLFFLRKTDISVCVFVIKLGHFIVYGLFCNVNKHSSITENQR